MSDQSFEEDFTLEDIIAEFGSAPDMPPPEPVLPGMASQEPVLPQISEEPEPEETPEEPPREKRRILHKKRKLRDTLRLPELTQSDLYEDDFSAQEETVEDYTFSMEDIQQEVNDILQPAEQLPEPPERVRSMDAIVRDVEREEKSLDNRFRICLVVTAVNLLLALYNGFGLHWVRGFENVSAMGVISLILMVCAAGVAYDVLWTGLCQLGTARFGPELLATVACVVAIPEAITAAIAGSMPLCALVSLDVLCAMWAKLRQAETMRTVAYVAEESADGCGVKRIDGAWKGRAAAARGLADSEKFETMLEADSADKGVMRIYVPAAIAASVILGALSAILGDVSFLRVWTALLIAAIPLSSFLCYVLPFSLLTERLSRKKAVLCGWYGARVMSGCEAIFLRDAELFPEGSLRLSGVKAFENYQSGQLMRYAAAILYGAHCDAAQLLHEDDEPLPVLSDLRCFDEDGYSAEIERQTVLLGTLGFMRKMGVHMEHGAKVRQALYLSIEGELAGIIALRYDADPEVRRTLETLSGADAPIPVLTGSDVLVTPGLLRAKFRLPLERLVCPPLRERIAAGELNADDDDLQAALIARPGLEVMGAVCMGARALVTAVRASVLLSILAGAVGMLVIFLLAISSAFEVVSCSQLLAFALIWVVFFLIAAFSVLKK